MINSTNALGLPGVTKTPSEDPCKLTKFYQVPSGLPKEVLDSLCKQCEGFEETMIPSQVPTPSGEQIVDENVRISKTHWIPTDHWIAAVMAHIVREANNNLFKFDLTRWASAIQYTVYDEKGSNYTWHVDSASSDFFGNEVRKLSISLLLSDPQDYEGGELQLLNAGKMYSYRVPRGTAVVFPSLTTHRVRPLKSGIRRSLVGWFGGPGLR